MPKIHPWPATIIAYFAIVICGAATLVVYSIKHKSQLVRADYYAQEVKYQKQIDRIKRTYPYLSKIVPEITENRILLSLPVAHTTARDFSGTAWLYRPSNAKHDKTFELNSNKTGTFEREMEGLINGLWKLKVNWTARGEEFFHENSIVTGNH